MYVVRHK